MSIMAGVTDRKQMRVLINRLLSDRTLAIPAGVWGFLYSNKKATNYCGWRANNCLMLKTVGLPVMSPMYRCDQNRNKRDVI